MQVVYFGSTPRTDKKIKEWINMFVANGWELINTEPALIDTRNTRYTVSWPENKGKPFIPKGFGKVKIVTV